MRTKNIINVKCLIVFSWLIHLLSSPSAAQQVNVSLTVKPPYSAQLSDYRHLEHKAIITLVNTSNNAVQVKLAGSLTNMDNGLTIRTNNDYRPSVPISVAPHGTTTVVANPGAMNFLDESNTTTNASDQVKQNIITTGLLPEGVYRLCIDAFDYQSNIQISASMQGCATFSISQAQPPVIIYPADGQTVPATQSRPTFSWTPPTGNLAGAAVRYKLVVVEVLAGQNPNDAISVARDYKANNPVVYKANLPSQIYVMQPGDLPFRQGHTYAVQVIAGDANNQLSFVNNGGSSVTVFNYGGGATQSNDSNGSGSTGACDQQLASLRAQKVKADAAFREAAEKRKEFYNSISKNNETVYTERAQKILNAYAVATMNKQAADSMLRQQEQACSDQAWQLNDRKENPVPVYCDLEQDLKDSLKKIDSTIAEKRKKIDSLGKTVAEGEEKVRVYADSVKRAKDSVLVADAGFKKAKKHKDLLDSNTNKGRTVAGADDITKKFDSIAAKKRKADSLLKDMEEKKRTADSTVAEVKKEKDVTIPDEIKKLEGDARRVDSLIDDCKKKKAEEEDRWRRRREETERIEKMRDDAKKAEAETSKYNNHVLGNLYYYECVCSKAEWDSKGIWDWLPEAINKPVSDALEDRVGAPIPLDALNALLALYYVVEAIKDPCSLQGCKRIGADVEARKEMNPKRGELWNGTDKCEEMCKMLKKIQALKK